MGSLSLKKLLFQTRIVVLCRTVAKMSQSTEAEGRPVAKEVRQLLMDPATGWLYLAWAVTVSVIMTDCGWMWL